MMIWVTQIFELRWDILVVETTVSKFSIATPVSWAECQNQNFTKEQRNCFISHYLDPNKIELVEEEITQ